MWMRTVKHFSNFTSSRFSDETLAHRADDIRERLSSALRIVDEVASVPASRLADQPVSEKDIRMLLKSRRNRGKFFESDLFADPAWDILLELYAAKLGQQRISVGRVCDGAAVPATTALRWIAVLETKHLIERKADPMDGRRFHVALTNSALDAMANYFRSVPDRTPLI